MHSVLKYTITFTSPLLYLHLKFQHKHLIPSNSFSLHIKIYSPNPFFAAEQSKPRLFQYFFSQNIWSKAFQEDRFQKYVLVSLTGKLILKDKILIITPQFVPCLTWGNYKQAGLLPVGEARLQASLTYKRLENRDY